MSWSDHLTPRGEKSFSNGSVHCLVTKNGYKTETTDTFLPYYTKDAESNRSNALTGKDLGSRAERWMIGVSVMSGCPVRCKFCQAGTLPKVRNLTYEEIRAQVDFVIEKNKEEFGLTGEHKINYTRMGEPFLNIGPVMDAIIMLNFDYPGTHHYISTIGVKGSDFSFIVGDTSLQFSVHSLDEEYRDWLIPYKNKMTLKEIGEVRTGSNLKTTINLMLVRESDFDIEKVKELFPKEHFFIKLSPLNRNLTASKNGLFQGVIKETYDTENK